MYEQPAEDISTLFIRLRKGDTTLQEEVPQRFDRWFLTIAMHSLGQKNHRQAYETACKEFSTAVKNITRKKDLVPQAYTIIKNNIKKSSAQFVAGDFSNMMLQQRPPSELLKLVWPKLSTEEQHIFSLFYIQRSRQTIEQSQDTIESLAFQALNIRQKMKRLMKEDASITFTNIQPQTKTDLIPLTLFESGMLAGENEKEAFETWLLNVPEVCNDLMEFVPFVQALQEPSVSSFFLPNSAKTATVEAKPEVKTKVQDKTEQPIAVDTVTSTPERVSEPQPVAPEPKSPLAEKPKLEEPAFPISEEIENYANQNSSGDTIKTIVIAVVMALVLIALLSFLNSN